MLEMKAFSSFLPGMIVGIILGAFAMLIIVPMPSTMSFVREGHYATYVQAVEHGAIARGWLPEFVPETASKISDIHCLDTNSALLRLSLPEAGRSQLRETMRSVPPSKCDVPAEHLIGLVEWWPQDVLRLPDHETFSATHRSTRCFAAISNQSDIVYLWF